MQTEVKDVPPSMPGGRSDWGRSLNWCKSVGRRWVLCVLWAYVGDYVFEPGIFF